MWQLISIFLGSCFTSTRELMELKLPHYIGSVWNSYQILSMINLDFVGLSCQFHFFLFFLGFIIVVLFYFSEKRKSAKEWTSTLHFCIIVLIFIWQFFAFWAIECGYLFWLRKIICMKEIKISIRFVGSTTLYRNLVLPNKYKKWNNFFLKLNSTSYFLWK